MVPVEIGNVYMMTPRGIGVPSPPSIYTREPIVQGN